ncbi:MAG: WecB/TagA/CpsF family glycosyltransferase [bacterium]|nr:WecB/TagA/CpsF family glycosyltransferase [bacterium]
MQQSTTLSEPTAVEVIGIRTHAQRFDEALARLSAWAGTRTARRVTFCSVHPLMYALEDADMRRALDTAAMTAADGMPVVWAQRALGFAWAERVYGPDMMLALCEATRTQPVRHFFLGGAPGVAEILIDTLQTRFPGITIAGWISPMIDERGDDPSDTVREAILQAQPDLIWVGLGAPKQDLWMLRNADLPCLMLGVGAAFDFISGRKPQAPRWMQRSGLEWVFRLVSEPRRLWQRYLIYNPRFVVGFTRQWLAHKLNR